MLRRLWNAVFTLDEERTIWVEEEDLGNEKPLYHKNRRYFVKIPKNIDRNLTLRLHGLGKKRLGKTGNLFLHVWVNKGEDIEKDLWLSETSARLGADKKLIVESEKLTLIVPPRSHHGLSIRVKGHGAESLYTRNAPIPKRKRGNLFVKLFVYQDNVTPQYGSFDSLSTEDMALEGWVYRKIDEAFKKVGKSDFRAPPVRAEQIADLFNEQGWKGIYQTLIRHLNLTGLRINVGTSPSIPEPGRCERTVSLHNNTPIAYNHVITINDQFLNNPFTVAAILAHELCHVVFAEKIEGLPSFPEQMNKSEKERLEEEHTVDLLVFLFNIGEFQLRVVRDSRLSLGYFHQEIFERMQVIVSKKLSDL